MRRTLKIILIISILFFLNFNFSFATSIEENAEETQISENISSNESNNENIDNTQSTSAISHTSSNYGVTSVNRINSYSEANLELNNILNIILIAIGVLIILFAIAILIRLKHTN